jgi:D-3-phosphoglycerate dehydrogenase
MNAGAAHWTALYLVPVTGVLRDVVREETPPGLTVLFLDSGSPDELARKLPLADALLVADSAVTAEVVQEAARLKLVQHQGVGHEKIDKPALKKAGVTLALCPAGTAEGVGEHTVTLILAVLKRVVDAHNSMVSGQWKMWELRPTTRDLAGKTVGQFGFGRTGRAAAKRLKGFDIRLIACDPYITLTEAERAQYGVTLVDKQTLLREADIVCCHVPLNDETRHLIGRPELEQMKRSAVLINVSRGGVIDQDAVIEALRTRRIMAGGFDVFSPEPLPAGHPFAALDNVVLTPHVAAGTLDAYRSKMRFALGNIARAMRGEEPLEQVVVE